MSIVPYPDLNITGLVELIQYANKVTEVGGGTGFLGIGILIIVGFVSFLATKDYEFTKALGFSAFLTLITALFLRFLNLINDTIFLVVVVIFVVSVLFLMKGGSSPVEA